MTEQAPYDPNSEKPSRRARAWSKAKQVTAVAARGVVRGAKAAAPEAKHAFRVMGHAIAEEAPEILARADKLAQTTNPEKRGPLDRALAIGRVALPIGLRAYAADVHDRFFAPSPDDAFTAPHQGAPFKAPSQPRPEPSFTHGFETAHTAGQTGSAHTGPYAKV